jgi:transposase-like protein
MNGLLFITVLVVLRQLSHSNDAVLPQANAYASDQVKAEPAFERQLGERHALEYQQWVALLQAEADALCRARKYERKDGRRDTRAGSYTRKLQTKSGEVKLKVPRLRSLPFETQIIERYKRREASVEEALIEMYLAGVSVRGV